MGLSGLILKKREDVDIQKTINDVKLAAERAGLEVRIDSILYKSTECGGLYTTANIANTFEDIDNAMQLLMYLYSASDEDYVEEFDWISKGGHLIQNINIENFDDCEEILLLFLYEYLKLNPEDIFWNELKWFYKYNDIVKIHNQSFDKEWCYKKPDILYSES